MFTKNFWTTTLEAVLVAFVTAFSGSQIFVTGFTSKNFIAAATTSLGAALVVFLKQLGSVQTATTKK